MFYHMKVVSSYFVVLSQSVEDYLTSVVVVYGCLLNLDSARRIYIPVQKYARLLEEWSSY